MTLLNDKAIDSLIHRFESSSKYNKHWLDLKYKHHLVLSIEDKLNKHRHYRKAINELKNNDHFFLQYCMLKFGTRLEFQSKSINYHTLELRLIKPEQKKITKFI